MIEAYKKVRDRHEADRGTTTGWPDPLKSSVADSMRSRNIDVDLTAIFDLFDQMEREIRVHRGTFCETASLTHTPAHETQMTGWQDISSAARDGSEILIWNGRRRHVAHFDKIEGEWVSSFKTTTKRLIVTPPPTYWSPLPAEPATTEGQS